MLILERIFNVLFNLPVQHAIASFFTVLITLTLLYVNFKYSCFKNKSISYYLLFLPFFIEIIYQIGHIYDGIWSVTKSLPLEFSYITSFSIIFLKFKDKNTFNGWLYFAGLWSAAAAFFNTLMIGNEPWYEILRYYGHHGLLLFFGLQAILKGFRPTRKNYFQSVIATSLIIIAIGAFNQFFGSNYMFTHAKPRGVNFSMIMPEWPTYFLVIVAIGLIFYSIIFIVINKNIRQKISQRIN